MTAKHITLEALGEERGTYLSHKLDRLGLQRENRSLGIFTYVTLGAIVGDYYHSAAGKHNKSALLKRIKKEFSRDPFNHLRTRKTII